MAGERISTAPVLAKGMLLFASDIPNIKDWTGPGPKVVRRRTRMRGRGRAPP
jgi:hypothetical protein